MSDYVAMLEAIVYNTTLQSLSVCYEGLCGAMGGRPLLQCTTEHYSVGPVLQSAMGATEGNKHPLVVLRAGRLFPDVRISQYTWTRFVSESMREGASMAAERSALSGCSF